MADPSEYEKDMPLVREHMRKFERAVANVRRSHTGRPLSEVRQVLLEEFKRESMVVSKEAAEMTARRIAGTWNPY